MGKGFLDFGTEQGLLWVTIHVFEFSGIYGGTKPVSLPPCQSCLCADTKRISVLWSSHLRCTDAQLYRSVLRVSCHILSPCSLVLLSPVASCTDEAAQSEVASSFKVCYTVSAKHWSHVIFQVSSWSAFCQIWPALCSHLMLGNFSSILICSCHSLKRYIVSSEHGLQTLWPPWHGIQGL